MTLLERSGVANPTIASGRKESIVADLSSARLRIEPLVSTHAEIVFAPLQDPRIYTYLPEVPPTAETLQRRYDFWEKGVSPDGKEQWLNWVAFLHESVTPVGTFQATLPQSEEGSIAFIVFPTFWRQGYGHEMAACVITHLFQTKAHLHLSAEIDTRNLASMRLVESLGLTRISTTGEVDFFKGASSDEHKYSISRDAWRMRAHLDRSND